MGKLINRIPDHFMTLLYHYTWQIKDLSERGDYELSAWDLTHLCVVDIKVINSQYGTPVSLMSYCKFRNISQDFFFRK